MITSFQRLHKRVVVDYVTNFFRPRAPLAEPGTQATSLPPLEDPGLVVPLTWAATNPQNPQANLGDALSPILVSALAGLPVTYQRFQSSTERLATVGTIGHKFAGGTVHLWGTGINPCRSRMDRPELYQIPPDTRLKIHALRGPGSARRLRQLGLEVPEVYGDPVWFLPAIFPAAPEPRYDLGVIVHLSELQPPSVLGQVRPFLKRYQIPPDLAPRVRLLNTLTAPTLEAIATRIQEITACRCIISTSLHGLVIAEAYGIPCAYLHYVGAGGDWMSMEQPSLGIDYRIRDFYRGVGVRQRYVYRQAKNKHTNWEQVLAEVMQNWEPLTWSPQAFLEAFPLPLAFNPLQGEPFQGRSSLSRIRF